MRVIKQAKFTYCSSGKALEKPKKSDCWLRQKAIEAIEDHGNQLFKSNEYIKNDINISRNSVPYEEQKKYLMNIFRENI